jgi:hypothetical protein
MPRSVDLSGASLRTLFLVFQLAALALALPVFVFGFGGFVGILFGALLALLLAATAVRLWRGSTDEGVTRPTAEDITYDPISDPGQAARERWQKAVRRLPDRDESED